MILLCLNVALELSLCLFPVFHCICWPPELLLVFCYLCSDFSDFVCDCLSVVDNVSSFLFFSRILMVCIVFCSAFFFWCFAVASLLPVFACGCFCVAWCVTLAKAMCVPLFCSRSLICFFTCAPFAPRWFLCVFAFGWHVLPCWGLVCFCVVVSSGLVVQRPGGIRSPLETLLSGVPRGPVLCDPCRELLGTVSPFRTQVVKKTLTFSQPLLSKKRRNFLAKRSAFPVSHSLKALKGPTPALAQPSRGRVSACQPSPHLQHLPTPAAQALHASFVADHVLHENLQQTAREAHVPGNGLSNCVETFPLYWDSTPSNNSSGSSQCLGCN